MTTYPTLSESRKIIDKFKEKLNLLEEDLNDYLIKNELEIDPILLDDRYQLNIWGMTLDYPIPEYYDIEQSKLVSIAVALTYIHGDIKEDSDIIDEDELDDESN